MRELINKGLRDIQFYKKEAGNTLSLFASQMLVLLFGLSIKSIQTEILSPSEYGKLALFGTITSILILFFQHASFSSLKVILVNNQNKEKERELFGIGFCIALGLGIIFSLVLFGFGLVADKLLPVSIGKVLQVVSPFCFILPFQFFISEIAIGANRLKSLALFSMISRGVFLLSLLLYWTIDSIGILQIILMNLFSWGFATAIIVFNLKPSFAHLRNNFNLVKEKNKSFGYAYYFGSIVNQSTYRLDEVFITYFVNITQLGYYTLASIICSPMTFLSRSFVNSIFKKLAIKDRIPFRVFVYNTIWLLICVVFLYFSSEKIVAVIFGDSYSQVAEYTLLLSVAFLFQGMYAPFSILTARSKGKELRNVAYAEAIVNVFGNVILVPYFLVEGAIYASILSRLTHFIGLWFYYNKMIKE